jgi:hypothetical protein
LKKLIALIKAPFIFRRQAEFIKAYKPFTCLASTTFKNLEYDQSN